MPAESSVCAGLQGRVLELGFGSGLNARYYPRAVTEVLAVEPSDLAWQLAQPRLRATSARVSRAGLDGERLDLDSDSVDAALSTYTLCTIPDVRAALRGGAPGAQARGSAALPRARPVAG